MYLIFGANGQVGREICDTLQSTNTPFLTFSHQELDIASFEKVDAAVSKIAKLQQIHAVINCAAYTAVDVAEGFGKEEAFRTNVTGPKNLACISAKIGCVFVHLSTDYVFAGTADEPYSELSMCEPLNEYGRTKLEGERQAIQENPAATYVLRTSWVYSDSPTSFVSKILVKARDTKQLKVVNDQIGQPTWARDVALATISIVENAQSLEPGIYHYGGGGSCTWFEFAAEILRLAEITDCEIQPVSGEDFQAAAKRPNYSVLSHQKWNTYIQAGVPLHPVGAWESRFKSSGIVRSGRPKHA